MFSHKTFVLTLTNQNLTLTNQNLEPVSKSRGKITEVTKLIITVYLRFNKTTVIHTRMTIVTIFTFKMIFRKEIEQK